MTIYCNHCTHASPPGTLRCPECGSELSTVLRTDSWTIGARAENDIVLDHPEVSGRHCKITKNREGRYLLTDLSSTNGTFVNGRQIDSPVMVGKSDVIMLGANVAFPWQMVGEREIEKTAPFKRMSKEIRIGAAEDNDIVLNYPMISGHHAKLLLDGPSVRVEDLGSTNGTFLNTRGQRIQNETVKQSDALFLGSYRVPLQQLLQNQTHETHPTLIPFTGNTLSLGRNPETDIVIDKPIVSWHHAQIQRQGGDFILTDLDSTNGTFVNGRRIDEPVRVGPEDEIGVGPYLIKLSPEGVIKQNLQGKFTLEARDVSLAVGKAASRKTLLDGISFSVFPGEFVGLMAPSGAGKTTLLKTALGYYRPTSGHVLVNGRNLHREYGSFRTSIGYVPQEDILHGDLTVGQALTYSAKLRLEKDLSERAIADLVDKVIERLGLFQANNSIRDTKIAHISGGQRRRVNMAIELLIDPSIFFLDEPTSGLSSEDALIVMQLLRDLANEGKIIVLTLHQPSLEVYRLMDNLILLHHGGKLVYYGPAYPDSLTFTNPEIPTGEAGANPDLALRGIGSQTPDFWQNTYRNSHYFKDFITSRKGRQQVESSDATEATAAPRKASGLRQWWILHCRNFRVKLQDKMNTGILLSQAPLIALLLAFSFRPKAGEPGFNFAPTPLFLLVLTAIWFGCSNAARDICGDWHIYQRERMYNLKIPPFVISKLSVGSLVCLIQCLVLVGIVAPFCKLSAPFLPLFGVVFVTSLTGMSIGLFISAFASPFKKRTEIAIGLTPLVLIPMVVLGGMVKPVKDMPGVVEAASMAMPSRWAFEAVLQLDARERTELLTLPNGVQEPEDKAIMEKFYGPQATVEPLTATLFIAAFFLAFLLATMAFLKQKDII